SRRVAACDRARGHGPLRGDPRHRQEDGTTGRARAEGEARRRSRRAGRGTRSDRTGCARRARLHRSGRRARARRGRSEPAGGGADPRSVEEGRMSVVARELLPEDTELERSLRPRTLDDFVGQQRVKEQLSIALDAAKARGEALDHALLAGPPGLGKTSLAFIVRNELGVGIRTVAGPAVERKGDLAAILTSLDDRDVLFIDALHRT